MSQWEQSYAWFMKFPLNIEIFYKMSDNISRDREISWHIWMQFSRHRRPWMPTIIIVETGYHFRVSRKWHHTSKWLTHVILRHITTLLVWPTSVVLSAWWRQQMEAFSASLAFCGEFTGHRWIPCTKVSDTELWYFLWYALEQTTRQTVETQVIWNAIAVIMTSP